MVLQQFSNNQKLPLGMAHKGKFSLSFVIIKVFQSRPTSVKTQNMWGVYDNQKWTFGMAYHRESLSQFVIICHKRVSKYF